MLSRKPRIVDKPKVGTCLNLPEVSRVPLVEGVSIPVVESVYEGTRGTGGSVQNP